jgi:RNA polymerase-binding transcription factor DksA
LGKEEKLKEQVALLRRAVARLASALAQPKDEFVRDSAIQSHTYEEELAEQVYAALPQALARFEALLSRLEEEGF